MCLISAVMRSVPTHAILKVKGRTTSVQLHVFSLELKWLMFACCNGISAETLPPFVYKFDWLTHTAPATCARGPAACWSRCRSPWPRPLLPSWSPAASCRGCTDHLGIRWPPQLQGCAPPCTWSIKLSITVICLKVNTFSAAGHTPWPCWGRHRPPRWWGRPRSCPWPPGGHSGLVWPPWDTASPHWSRCHPRRELSGQYRSPPSAARRPDMHYYHQMKKIRRLRLTCHCCLTVLLVPRLAARLEINCCQKKGF